MICQTLSPIDPTHPQRSPTPTCPSAALVAMATTWDASWRQQWFIYLFFFFGHHWLIEFAVNYEPDACDQGTNPSAGVWNMAADLFAVIYGGSRARLAAPLWLLFASQRRNDCACLRHGSGNYSIMAHGEFCCWDQEILRVHPKACFNQGDEALAQLHGRFCASDFCTGENCKGFGSDLFVSIFKKCNWHRGLVFSGHKHKNWYSIGFLI